MKKRLLFSLLMLLGTLSVSAQNIIITDQETQQPIASATLLSKSPASFAVTNVKGMVNISVFRGAESIQIRSLGYKTVTKSYQQLSSEGGIALVPTGVNLDEVVISATRWRQTADNVPSKIIAITPDEVALQNPQTTADLLGLSGKVFIQKSQQGGGSPMIRGFATNRLLYTVDGVRMNTAIFRSGNIQNVINLDPFATEHTEVLFGPNSVIYGSDAIGGVMNFQTLTPQLSPTGEVLVSGKAVMRYASANQETTGHFDVSIGGKKWASVTSFSAWDYDHLRQGSHGPDDYLKPYFIQREDSIDRVVTQEDPLLQIPSAYSQMNLMQKVRFKPTEHWDFQYGFHYSTTSPYGRYDRHNRMRNGLPRYAEWDYGAQSWMMNQLAVSHAGNNTLYDHATLRLAHQQFEESRIDRSLNANMRSIRTEQVDAYSLNLDFAKQPSQKHVTYYGFEYVWNDVTSLGTDENITTNERNNGPTRYPQASWHSVAAYLQHSYEVTERLTLQAGLRYNQFSLDATFDTTFYPFPFTTAQLEKGALTGSIGGVFRPTEQWVVSANFGTAFRSPNVDDVGKVFDSEPGAVVVPNPNLQAETAYNFDVGIAKIFGEIAKLDITGYYTHLDNALVRRSFSLNGETQIMYDGILSDVQAIQNAAQANVYGIQAGLEIHLPSGFQFSTDANLQVGEEELDDGSTSTSRHAAPFFGTTRLSYQKEGLQLMLYADYQGERSFEDLPVEEQGKDEIYAKDENSNNYAPAWYTVNVKAQYLLNTNFTINAGMENLTDQRYRPYSSGISGPGRNFILSVTARF